ncbi:MAG TPA: substrate-binding domain-containing protein [Vicinamibacterales bacterium]|nr:substrate-binding domain-containing protein [Vicinamibacterales bacterium]
MTIRAIGLIVVAAALFTDAERVDAQTTARPIKVLASNGFRAVMEDLAPRCEKTLSLHMSTDYGTSTSLLQRVNGGEAFDVAVTTVEAMDDLVKAGKVNAASRTPLGRSGIGVGVRKGASKPDIKSVDAVKRTLVSAKSVTYAGDGASRPHIEAMFKELGITQAMASKTILEQGSVRAAAKVASGDAELLITLVSEILPAPGVDLVGPLPDRFQHYVSFAAATGNTTANAEAGKALIGCFSGPEVLPVLKARGMER